jgi:hypothetical protein
VTCDYPIAAGDGHDFPRLIDERVPGVAAVIDDVVEGFENSVRQPVLPHELPNIFLAVEFRRAWRKQQKRDVVWNLEGLGAMPPA